MLQFTMCGPRAVFPQPHETLAYMPQNFFWGKQGTSDSGLRGFEQADMGRVCWMLKAASTRSSEPHAVRIRAPETELIPSKGILNPRRRPWDEVSYWGCPTLGGTFLWVLIIRESYLGAPQNSTPAAFFSRVGVRFSRLLGSTPRRHAALRQEKVATPREGRNPRS